jgi:hypothetical protein
MQALAVRSDALAEKGEARSLARQLADAYRERVACFKHELGLSTEEPAATGPCMLP